MNRNAISHFDSFDPEVIEAARDVASRAGVPLEAWIASVVPQHLTPFGASAERQVPQETSPTAQTTARDTDGSASSEGLATLMTRLDGLDRSVDNEHRTATQAEQKRLEEIELRIDRPDGSDFIWSFVCPADEDTSIWWMVNAYPLGGDPAQIAAARDLQIEVGVEDLWILEQMEEPNIPLDVRAEVHTKADLGCLEYRRMLAELHAMASEASA